MNAALNATTIARAFEVMLPARENDGLFLAHNPHRGVLVQPLINMPPREQTAAEFLADRRKEVEFTGPLEQQKIEETDTLWLLEWTAPKDTKQTKVASATLPALAQWLQDNGLAFGS